MNEGGTTGLPSFTEDGGLFYLQNIYRPSLRRKTKDETQGVDRNQAYRKNSFG